MDFDPWLHLQSFAMEGFLPRGLTTLFCCFIIIELATRGRRKAIRAPKVSAALLAILFVGVIGSRITTDLLTLNFDTLSSWDASIQDAAAAWAQGQPLYPSAESGLFYGLLYGPLLFEMVGFSQRLFGLTSSWVALPSMLAEPVALAITFWTMRRLSISRPVALACCGAMFAGAIWITPLIGTRADPALLLLAALALATLPALERGSLLAALGLGLCGGLGTALKISALPYVCGPLLCALLHPQARRGLTAAAAAGTAIGLAIPYLQQQGLFIDHIRFLAELRPFGIQPENILQNFMFVAITVAAIQPWRGMPASSLDRRLLVGLIISMVPIILVATTEGTGLWHFQPFFPIIVVLVGRKFETAQIAAVQRPGLLALLAILAVLAIRKEYLEIGNITNQANARAAARMTLARFIDDHPNESIAISDSIDEESSSSLDNKNSSLQIHAIMLLEEGQPLRYTATAFNDMRSNIYTARLIEKQFDTCEVKYWITPRGRPFFAKHSSDTLTEAFEHSYHRIRQTAELQVWTCHPLTD